MQLDTRIFNGFLKKKYENILIYKMWLLSRSFSQLVRVPVHLSWVRIFALYLHMHIARGGCKRMKKANLMLIWSWQDEFDFDWQFESKDHQWRIMKKLCRIRTPDLSRNQWAIAHFERACQICITSNSYTGNYSHHYLFFIHKYNCLVSHGRQFHYYSYFSVVFF